MTRHAMRSLSFAAAALLAAADPLAAQVKLEVTPQFASFYATNYLSYVDASNLERQEAGPGVGGALTWRFTNIWAVEGQVTFIKSGVVVKNTGFSNFEPPTDGSLTMANVRVLVQPRRTNLFFALGAGTARRGGEAFDVPGIDDKVDVAGIVGVGIRTRVTPEWGFRLGVEMHLYSTDPDEGNAYYQKRTQRDVLVTIGVPFALIGR
jgi:Outer membrane protein beta-barrel domain